MTCHSMRSKFTTFPPAAQLGFSCRGTYPANLEKTARLPETYSFASNTQGPEPITWSMVIAFAAGCEAMCSGMMKGTLDAGLASAASSSGNGFLSRISKDLSALTT